MSLHMKDTTHYLKKTSFMFGYFYNIKNIEFDKNTINYNLVIKRITGLYTW